ncbi:Serine/threonine-protein phosphatase 7 long form [Glycine soja]
MVPVDGDVLWMQDKQVSQHIWNGEEDKKLHIRRAVPMYQGQGEIPEEIIPLLRQSGFYWIMKMGYLKINAAISALIERWRPETHTFHMRCRDLRVDGSPLIGPTNLNWADLCEELLGVRPQQGELQGSMIKLSWLAHHFPQLNNHDGNLQQVERFTRAWILRFIGGVLFVDKGSNKVFLRYMQFLRDFRECSTYAWGLAVLAYLYREMCNMCSATDYKIKSIKSMRILIQMWAWERCTTLAPKRTPPPVENKPLGHRWLRRGNQHIGNEDLIVFRRKLDIMKRHEFLWEPYTTNVMSVLSPIYLVGSVAWCAVVPLICFQVIEWHQPDRILRQFGMQQPIPRCPSQPLNIHGITLKDKNDENWGQLSAPMINQWNKADFRVDGYPRQGGLLNFNSNYMAKVAETLQYMVSPEGRNTRTVDDLVPYVEKITILSEEQESITEPVSHGPATEHQFAAQQYHILPSSVETQGIGRRREVVEVEPYVYPQMGEHGHRMYYTPPTFSQYPTQMYQYPFEGHQSDTSASSSTLGGVAETYPNFSWPAMTLSQQHDVPIPTPNAPLGTQWNVPGAIPDMGDLLGVDLHHQFSAKADQVKAGRHRGRRNLDRQAQRWDRPCGTSSRHHRHHNERFLCLCLNMLLYMVRGNPSHSLSLLILADLLHELDKCPCVIRRRNCRFIPKRPSLCGVSF